MCLLALSRDESTERRVDGPERSRCVQSKGKNMGIVQVRLPRVLVRDKVAQTHAFAACDEPVFADPILVTVSRVGRVVKYAGRVAGALVQHIIKALLVLGRAKLLHLVHDRLRAAGHPCEHVSIGDAHQLIDSECRLLGLAKYHRLQVVSKPNCSAAAPPFDERLRDALACCELLSRPRCQSRWFDKFFMLLSFGSLASDDNRLDLPEPADLRDGPTPKDWRDKPRDL
eukprot:1916107-Prymnesium_polylepis.1